MASIKKKPVTMSIDSTVLEEVKKTAGLIPLSRYVEDVLRKDLKARRGSPRPSSDHSIPEGG